jgi:hypothetical protein
MVERKRGLIERRVAVEKRERRKRNRRVGKREVKAMFACVCV